jgi:hypothetical protein
MLREDVDLELLGYLTPEERAELDALLVSDGTVWRPLPGPQSDAYEAQADIIGYGGAAGGGKTDLACGKSLTQHRKVGIFRLNGTELTSFLDRFEELIGDRKGYNGQDKIWRITRADGVHVQLEFGSFPKRSTRAGRTICWCLMKRPTCARPRCASFSAGCVRRL